MRVLSLTALLCVCLSALPAGATDLEGLVVNAAGKPVSGAKVYATSYVREAPPEGESWKSEVRTAVTDAAGRFRVEDVYCPPDRRMNHFALVQAAGLALGGTAFTVPAKEPLRIRLAPAAPWRAVVVDAAGKPVPNCPVLLEVWRLNFSGKPLPQGALHDAKGKDGRPLFPIVDMGRAHRSLLTKRTDARGEVLFTSAPKDGALWLHLLPEEHAHQRFHGVQVDECRPTRLVVQSGGAITGRVVMGATGEPRPGVLVGAIHRMGSAGPGPLATNERGEYAFSNLLPGRYVLTAATPSGEELTVAPLRITVAPDETVHVPDLKLTEGGIVSGRVTDAKTGQPLAGIPIGAAMPGYRGLSAVTDAEGRYRLRLPAWRGYLEYSGGVPGYRTDTPGFRVHVVVEEGKSVTADLKLVKGALSGTWRPEVPQVTLRAGTYPMTWVDNPGSQEHRYSLGGGYLASWSTAKPASVKREPPLPRGASRRYTSVRLGEPAKSFVVILEESAKGKGVDVLYADTDGDGDLAEEHRLARSVSRNVGNLQHVAFPHMTFACPTGEATRPVSVLFQGYQGLGRPGGDLVRRLAGYWEGEIDTAKGKLRVLMGDRRGEASFSQRDAVFMLDLTSGMETGYAPGERQQQGRAQLVCGKLYRFTPSRIGDQLTIEAYDGPTGTVRISARDGRGGKAAVESVWVGGSAGSFYLGGDEETRLPPGIYTFGSVELACGEGAGRVRMGLKPKKPFAIDADRTTEVALGGPITVTLQGAYTVAPAGKGKPAAETRLVFLRGCETKVKIELADAGGASVAPDSRAQQRKAFRGALLDRKGKRIVHATIEYG